jgi:hypothetical protein
MYNLLSLEQIFLFIELLNLQIMKMGYFSKFVVYLSNFHSLVLLESVL